MSTTRVPPTPQEINKRQKADAEQRLADRRKPAMAGPPAPSTAVVPAKTTAVAAPDNRTDLEKHFDEVAPGVQFPGRRIEFDHATGKYSTADDGEPIADGSEYIALCDETAGGWIRFNGAGEPPTYGPMGVLYGGFIPPKRDTLSDPELADTDNDPWKRHYLLPLQDVKTQDLFFLSTAARTKNAAVIHLLREFDRKRRTDPGKLPVVTLKAIGFQPKDYNYMYKPVLVRLSWANRDAAVKPDTSLGGDMQDEIPF